MVQGLDQSMEKCMVPTLSRWQIDPWLKATKDSVGTMHFSIDWSKPWTIPHILKETGVRQKEMEHMGAAYMAEGIVTLAGSRLYTSAAYTEEMIDDVLSRFDRVLANCGPIGG